MGCNSLVKRSYSSMSLTLEEDSWALYKQWCFSAREHCSFVPNQKGLPCIKIWWIWNWGFVWIGAHITVALTAAAGTPHVCAGTSGLEGLMVITTWSFWDFFSVLCTMPTIASDSEELDLACTRTAIGNPSKYLSGGYWKLALFRMGCTGPPKHGGGQVDPHFFLSFWGA